MRDLTIVGCGPAAWSCGITAAQRGLDTAVIAAATGQSWLEKAERISNYPGMPDISGKELLCSMRKHCEGANVDITEGSCRQIVKNRNGTFMLLCGNDIIESRAVCIATGTASPAALPGEIENLGSGVSWCGTCDGMFFRGKNIAVLSEWNGGDEDTVFLSRVAASIDYYPILGHKGQNIPALCTVLKERPQRIEKAEKGITLTSKNENGEEKGRTYDGIFVFRHAVSSSRLLAGLKTEGSFITVDRMMRTSVPMVYAAGDCTGRPLQIAKAVGEGNIAAISCSEDLQMMKGEKT